MKIGVFNPYLDGLTGGEKYMLSLSQCLSEFHEVSILWDDLSILNKAENKFGIDLSRIKVSPNIFSPQIPLIKRLLESKKYDAIIILSDGSIPFVLSKLFVHFQFPVEWVNGMSIKNKLKISRVNTIFCNSFFTKSYIDKTFKISSKVLYPPILTNLVAIPKENIILTVGRFGRTLEGANYKKQDVMIDAFKKLIDKGLKKWRFILVVSLRDEDIEKFEHLKKQAENYPIEFCINPDNKKLWKYYNASKIYWHASGYGEDLKKNPEYAEHFGMSTVEAMGVGTVPIVINAGGQVEIVENGKNGFLWNSIDELLSLTEKLANNTTLWKKLSKESIKRAQDFNMDSFSLQANEMI